ncbi:MAG TPA: 2Fe-2S iron-sulfur cluster-binding protein [Ilumatobacteraceae bacterium]|nr:2Fe-2S iron-sulfur cluster-binding protein [Ilumatobacteraceae bacterium]
MSDQTNTHRCTVVDGDTSVSFDVSDGGRLLHEMIAHRCTAIAVGCRGGGCGVCRVRILDGTYTTKRMSRRHVSEADEDAGVVLACRTFPSSDLTVCCEPASVPTLSSA